ncbi:cupin domain-containing protein [Streptomyces sp. NRRL F-5053]|uniref:cupin domain-containing protein n=1 Tax=Streptomyces sp. NRRL F-5053 TaxID=1463854 RepID=UPI0006924D43|nr:cupin domain-containing protein [Streptomyces sp. NRRL F-5053]
MSDTLTARPEVPQQRAVTVLRGLLTAEGREALDWHGWDEPGRAGVQIRPLYTTRPPHAATAFLVRFGPGAHGDLHEHLGHELMFVLDGELINDNGDRYTAGDLIVEEPGSVHRVRTETGVTVLGVREGPTVPREAG